MRFDIGLTNTRVLRCLVMLTLLFICSGEVARFAVQKGPCHCAGCMAHPFGVLAPVNVGTDVDSAGGGLVPI